MHENTPEKPAMLDPFDEAAYIRDNATLSVACRKTSKNFVIAYTPLEFMRTKMAVTVLFPPGARAPSPAQFAAFSFVMDHYGDEMEADVFAAAFQRCCEDGDYDFPTGNVNADVEEFFKKMALPAFLQIRPEEVDGMAYTAIGFFVLGDPPRRFAVKMLRDEVVDVEVKNSPPRGSCLEEGCE